MAGNNYDSSNLKTFDTKGKEFAYVKGLLEELDVQPFIIHTGVFDGLIYHKHNSTNMTGNITFQLH